MSQVMMYRIIGADQREYGPIPAERVRRWIGEGRANAQTKARLEGTTEWRVLGDFLEFGEMLAAQAAVSTPPPQIATTETDRMAAEIVARNVELDVGMCFNRGWRLLQENFWLLVGSTAVVLLIGLGLVSVPLVGLPAVVLLGFVFLGGLHWVFLKRARGQRADMADAFAGFSLAFVPLMLAGLVIQLLTAAGLIVCIVPGIYFFVIWWGFVPLLVLDKKMDFWPAMELSRKVVHHHGWQVAGLMLAVLVVIIAGLLAFLVGVFFTLPLAIAAVICAYEDLFNPPSQAPGAAPTTPTAPVDGGSGGERAPTVPAADTTGEVVTPVESERGDETVKPVFPPPLLGPNLRESGGGERPAGTGA
jgi:hypothetical protein